MDLAAISGLRRSHGYPQYLIASTVARLADEMFAVAVVLLVLQRTGSPALAGVTIAAATFPSIVSGPLIGAWLDRTGRRRLLYTIDRVLLFCCLIAILLAAGHVPAFVVLGLACITGITLPATHGGLTSMIPSLVAPGLLVPANSLEASSFNVGLIVGPALAGTLAAVSGAEAAVVGEAVLTLVSLALILRIPELDRRVGDVTGSLARLVASGLRHVARDPVIRAVTVTGMVNMVCMGFLVVAFPLWAAGDLGADESAAGHLWAAFAFGSLVGALGLARVQRGLPQDAVFFVGIGGLGLVMLAWPLAGSLPAALALVALAAVTEGPALAADLAIRQQRTPNRLMTQVLTTIGSTKAGAFAIGAALAGAVVESAGARTTILLVAVADLVAVAVGVAMRVLGGRGQASPRPG